MELEFCNKFGAKMINALHHYLLLSVAHKSAAVLLSQPIAGTHSVPSEAHTAFASVRSGSSLAALGKKRDQCYQLIADSKLRSQRLRIRTTPK